MAHVSVATVSRVINDKGYVNEETKQMVLEAIKKLNYVPNELARSLFKKHSKILGVIVPHFTSYYITELLDRIENHAINSDYRLMICNSQGKEEREEKYLHAFQQYNIDGILLVSNTKRIQDYKNLEVPIVAIDHNFSEEIPSITSDNEQGGILAAEKLLESNPKKIIHFRGPSDLITVQARSDGFEATLDKAGIKPIRCDLDFKSPQRELIEKTINEHKDVDGIFCDSDIMALKAIQCLNKLDKAIPDEVQVIGFDDIELSKIFIPSLSTIAQPTKNIAEHAVTALINLIHDKNADSSTKKYPVRLIERETTI